MADPIDPAAERNKCEQPDPQFVRHDAYGRPLFMFTTEYEMDGKRWGLDLWAYSHDDAAARAVAIRESLIVNGQVYDRIPL